MKKISCTFFNSIAWRSLALGILMLCAGGLSAQDQVCATATGYDTIHNIVNPTVNRTVTVAGIPAGQIVEQVSVEFAIRHTWAGDLQLELTAPNGVTVFLGNNSTSCDLSKNGPITFYDGAPNNWNVTSCVGGFICLNNGQCEFAPAQPMVNTFAFQNGEQANGDWNFYVADMVGGDHGGLYDVTVCVDYAVAPTCDVTCPSDITINLDPGACCAQYTYSPILDGTDPLCVLVP